MGSTKLTATVAFVAGRATFNNACFAQFATNALRAAVWVMLGAFLARSEALAASAGFLWKQPVDGAFMTAANWSVNDPALEVDPGRNDTATVPPRAGDAVEFVHGSYSVDMLGAPSLSLLNFEDGTADINLQVVGALQVHDLILPAVGVITLTGGGEVDGALFWTDGARLLIDGGVAKLNNFANPTGSAPEDPLREIVVQAGGTLITTGPSVVTGVTLENSSLWEYHGEPDQFTSAVTLSGGSTFSADEIKALKTVMTAEGGSRFDIPQFWGTQVQLSSGSQMINQNARAGNDPHDEMTFVDGPQSAWIVSGTFTVYSVLTVRNGGSMTCGTVSDNEYGGTILVQDDGSLFTVKVILNATNEASVQAKNGGHVIVARANLVAGSLVAEGTNAEFHSAGSITVSQLTGVGSGQVIVSSAGKGSASDLTMHGGIGDVAGTGSLLELTNNLAVGMEGAATFTIEQGGRVTSGAGYVGGTLEGDGSVTVRDAGSVWEMQTGGFIGDAGKGSVFIDGGGKVLVSDENSGLALGFEPPGRGTVVVDGGSMLEARGMLAVGKQGQGILMLRSGGSVTAVHLSVGESAFTNRVTLTDPGTELRVTSDLIAGNGGTGVLQASSGSRISTAELRVGVESKAKGTGVGIVVIQNAGSLLTVSNILAVGDSEIGVLTVSDGAQLEFQGNNVQVANSGGPGLLAVTGANSEMNATNAQMQAGVQGVATLTVSSGGVLRTKGGQAGINNSAQVIIGHPGALWDVGGDLEIGVNDFGYFTIDDQGAVNSARGYIGRARGSHGLLFVLRQSVWQPGQVLTIGEGGLGNVVVNGGGRIELAPGTLDLGLLENSEATLSIELPDSAVNAGLSTTRIAVKGDALVQVTGGASLHTGPTSVAVGLETSGQVFVVGPQSIWTVESGLLLGVAGQARLNVDDQATVVVNGPLTVGPGGGIKGSGTITATKFIYSGILQPGHSPGALSLKGDFQQQTMGELEIEIAGTTPATQFDVVNVTGQVSLAGKVTFQFINGFAPRKGQSFEFLTASAGITNNATVAISGLAPGFQYDVQAGNGGKSLILEVLSDGIATSVPQEPSLAIQKVGPELAVTWSSVQPNMTLQGNTSVNSTSWTNLTSAHRWLVSPTNSAQFFRLYPPGP